MAVLRLSRLVLRIAVSLALAIAILWAAAALWVDGPESRVLAGMLAICCSTMCGRSTPSPSSRAGTTP